MMRLRVARRVGLPAGRLLAPLFVTAFLAVSAHSETTTFTYDVHGRLKNVVIPNGADDSVITYSYDAASNRISTVTQTGDTDKPNKPTGLDATVVSWYRIDLSWTASTDVGSSGISHYNVYRGASLVGSPSSVTFQDEPLAGNTPYTYRVSAVDNAQNESDKSDPVSRTTLPEPDEIPPTSPSALVAAVVSDNWINLAWTGSTDSGGSLLSGYEIFRNDALIGTSPVASYPDNTVAHSTSYNFKVRAYDGAGNRSGFSNVVTIATPDRIAPSVPSGLSATVLTSTSIQLDWADSTDTGGAGLLGYNVYRNGSYLASSSWSGYNDATVTGGQTYTYRVSSYDASSPPNESAQSAQVEATTQPDWTSITSDNGSLLPAENSWYAHTTPCDTSTAFIYCTHVYKKKYGNQAVVWNITFDPFAPPFCPGYGWGASGYRQDSWTCRVEANSSAYHQ